MGFIKYFKLKKYVGIIFLLVFCFMLSGQKDEIVNATSMKVDATLFRDILYKSTPQKKLKMDLYIPAQGNGPFPLVVWISGGGWMGISRHGAALVSAWLTTYGIAVAGIDYRLSSDAIHPAQIQDCLSAIRYIRLYGNNYNIDTSRIGVWGDSAGGHLAALCGGGSLNTTFTNDSTNMGVSSRVKAVCSFYPPLNLQTMPYINAVEKLVGGNKDKLVEASPITYVNANYPPILIVHGDKDNIVPIEQSKEFVEVLKKFQIPYKFEIMPGIAHDGGKVYGNEEIKKMVLEFFKERLK